MDKELLTKKEMFNEVARRVDTAGTAISVSETYRVLSVFIDYVKDLVADGHSVDEIMKVLEKTE